MQFQVPQFLETEVKIVGPLTLKQFLWLGGGAGLIFMLQFFLPFAYLLPAAIIIIILAVAFAFYKIDGMSLFTYLSHAFNFLLAPKKYFFARSQEGSYLPKDENVEGPIGINRS